MNNSSKHIERFISANPLFPIVTFFAIGIICGQLYSSVITIPAIIVACIAVAMKKTVYAGWAIATVLGAVAFLVSPEASKQIVTPSGIRYYEAEIIKSTESDNFQSATIMILKAGHSPENLTDCRPTLARMTIPTFDPQLLEGHSVLFFGEMQPIAVQTDLPDEWTSEIISIEQGIKGRFFINESNIVSVSESPGILSFFKRQRHELKMVIYQTTLSTDAKEFLVTTILGDSSDMAESTRNDYRDSGLSHILALSGLHVGLIAMLISLALWPLRIFANRWLTSVAVIIFLWIFAAIAGFGPSVTRAVIMTTIYLFGRMIQRRSSPFNSLCFAAFIILIFDPSSLFSVGFQLSFSAVASIIVFADLLNPVSRRHRFAYICSSYISISLAAMIGTGLISTICFHSFPLYFLPANLFIAVLLPLIIGGGLILLIWQLITPAPELITHALSYLIEIVNTIASFFSNLPNSTINNLYLSGWTAVIYALMLISVVLWIKTHKIVYGVFTSVLLIMLVSIIAYSPKPEREGTLYTARTTYRTDFIIDNLTDTLFVVSTRPQQPEEVIHRIRTRYSDYMGRRNIKNIKLIDSTHTSSGFFYQNNILRWGENTIGILSSNEPIPPMHLNYAIVCRGYRNAISEIICRYHPDSIILAYDLDKRRLARYESECQQLQQPYISLRQRPWNLPFRRSD